MDLEGDLERCRLLSGDRVLHRKPSHRALTTPFQGIAATEGSLCCMSFLLCYELSLRHPGFV